MPYENIKLLNFTILILVILSWTAYGQVIQGFNMQDEDPNRNGLVGNGITDLLWENDLLMVGTGFGLSTTMDEGVISFDEAKKIRFAN